MEVIEEKVEAGGKEIEEKPKESAEADEGNRSGFRVAEELGANRREEKSDGQIARETQATCKESSIAVAGVGGRLGRNLSRRQRSRHSTLIATILTDKIDIIQPERL